MSSRKEYFLLHSNDFQTAENVLAQAEMAGLAPETFKVFQDMVEKMGFERRDVAAKKENKQFVKQGQLLVLGEPRNGKTSLIKAITGEEFDPEEKQTSGVEFKFVDRKWKIVELQNMKFGDFNRYSRKRVSDIQLFPRIFNDERDHDAVKSRFGGKFWGFVLIFGLPICLGAFLGVRDSKWLILPLLIVMFVYFFWIGKGSVTILVSTYFHCLGTCLAYKLFVCFDLSIPMRLSSFLEEVVTKESIPCYVHIMHFMIFLVLEFGFLVCIGPVLKMLLLLLVKLPITTGTLFLNFVFRYIDEVLLPIEIFFFCLIFFAPTGLSFYHYSIVFYFECVYIFLMHIVLLYHQNILTKRWTIVIVILELAIAIPLCVNDHSQSVHVIYGFIANIILLCFGVGLHIHGNWLELKDDFKGKSFSQVVFRKDFLLHTVLITKALIDMKRLKQALNDKFCSLKLKILDFAGDEEYYVYHQIFLNSDALYVIVFNIQEYIQDNSKDIKSKAKRLRFWLESIHSHVPQGTPIFLVGTHRADTGIDTLRQINTYIYNTVGHTFIDEIISNKKDHLMFFPVENSKGADDKGIVSLRENITSVADEFENVIGQEIPLSWIKVQDAIMQHNENPQGPVCLTVEDFKEHFKHLYIEWDDKMLKYFHNKGFIIYKDNDKDEVKDKDKNEDKEEVKDKDQVKDQVKHKDEVKDGPSKWVLLNPDLLVQIVILLINPPEELTEQRGFIRHWIILRKSGMITTDLLQFIISRVIGEQENEDSSNLLVTFLEEYDLICPLYKDPLRNMQKVPSIKEMTHFVPSLLRPTPSSQPVWNESKEDIKFYIFFDSFLPDALFYRLLSRACKVSYDEIKRSYEPSESIYRDCGVFCLSQQLYCLRLQKKEGRIEVTLSKPKSLWVPNYILTLIGSIVASICKREYQNLSFHCGPECSSPICPGSQSDSTSLLTGQPRRHVHNVYPACQQGGICFLDLFKCQNAYREEDAKMWRPR